MEKELNTSEFNATSESTETPLLIAYPSYPKPLSSTGSGNSWRVQVAATSIEETNLKTDWDNRTADSFPASFLHLTFDGALPANTTLILKNDAGQLVNQLLSSSGQTSAHLPVMFPGTAFFDLELQHPDEQDFPALQETAGGLIIVANITGEDEEITALGTVRHGTDPVKEALEFVRR